MIGCEFMQTHSFPMIPWVKKKADWWIYYCLGTLFSSQWGNQKLWLGSGCPVPLKLERCFYMNLQPIFPMLCASSDDQETCNQKTFQNFFSSIKQVCRMRKGLASKYLEDWLLLFHQNLLRAKGWSAFVILPPSHGISISPLKYEWALSLEPVNTR